MDIPSSQHAGGMLLVAKFPHSQEVSMPINFVVGDDNVVEVENLKVAFQSWQEARGAERLLKNINDDEQRCRDRFAMTGVQRLRFEWEVDYQYFDNQARISFKHAGDEVAGYRVHSDVATLVAALRTRISQARAFAAP